MQIMRATRRGAPGSAVAKLPPTVLQLLVNFCTEPRILLADRTVDVGLADLHRTLEYVVATGAVVQASEFKQLVGRVSRLAADVQRQGSIHVVCTEADRSLEGVLQAHLKQQLREGS